MPFKHFAMLAAISYNIQQIYSNNNKNNKTNNNNYNKTTIATTLIPESATNTQQQQQQQQTQQITSPIFASSTDTTTATAPTTTPAATLLSSSSPFLLHPLYLDKLTTFIFDHKNYHKNRVSKDEDSINDIISGDSSNYSSESSENLDVDQQATPERQPSNTYTSTTYYGSGFGVFHQQNTRSNNGGGGIALISGSSAGNGLSAGSYSNGINNNVNLLLGGAMLTLITTILCVVCYCCHRNIKKRTEAAYRQQRQWLENDPNMEIYSVEQCYETSGIFVGESMDGLATIPTLHHEPPPSYDAVVAMQEQQQLIMQQHQHQILMQQQLLQQQLSINSSPPPGYRSSLDVSSALQQGRASDLEGVLTVGGSVISGMEINSLASSSANLRTVTSISPIDSLLNHNDINGNVAADVSASNTTPPNNRTAACYLRNKQQQQQHQQRNSAVANQMSQLSMKKVLQAQSCCSLQRAEVENMWNAAAAALAARSSHLASDSRASTTTSTSSPTLIMNTRKPDQGCKSTPETFGTRYLKQNYYRRGCPLCGKFRYDNDDSTLSISMESNLDTLAGALIEEVAASGEDNNMETTLNIVNNNESPTNCLNKRLEEGYKAQAGANNEAEVSGNEVDNNDNEIEQQCSCLSSKRKHDLDSTKIEEDLQKMEELKVMAANEPEVRVRTAEPVTPHDNPNCASLEIDRQSTNQAASNNNNDITNMEFAANSPLTLAAAETGPTIPRSADTDASTSSTTSTTTSVTINLDCINENGIISLDMSRIIDKTGLPTYDAALKLESSGYV